MDRDQPFRLRWDMFAKPIERIEFLLRRMGLDVGASSPSNQLLESFEMNGGKIFVNEDDPVELLRGLTEQRRQAEEFEEFEAVMEVVFAQRIGRSVGIPAFAAEEVAAAEPGQNHNVRWLGLHEGRFPRCRFEPC